MNDVKGIRLKGPLLATLYILLTALFSCSSRKLFTDVNHIVHMGQSLGGGEQSLPLVTDSATGFGNLAFKMGTSTWTYNQYPDQPALRPAGNFAFVPLTARQRGVEGETIANGLCDHLVQSLQNTSHKKARFLFSYSGQGGRYLRELDKRHDDAKDPRAGLRQSKGGHYNTSMDDVKRAKETAASLHLSYSVAAITWMQGERGNDLRVNRWDSVYSRPAFLELYKKDLIDLKNDCQQDIKIITGQKNDPPFFTYQTNGTLSGTAQLMACDEEKDMFMVSPTYMLPSAINGYYHNAGKMIRGAAIHLAADGERWLGELFGKVIRKVIVEKEDWMPLRPVKASYDKNEKSITVKFHVPQPPLVIDDVLLPRQGNGLGFEVYDQYNRVYAANKVSVAGADEIKILLKDSIRVNTPVFIRYGLTSYVMEVAKPVKDLSIAKDSSGEVKIIFEGNIMEQFIVLAEEGAFYLSNRVEKGTGFSKLLIRSVFLDENGDTVLKGEKGDAQTKVNFKAGQQCFVSRIYGYGNIHDSDPERSVFTFRDGTYGTRTGQPYPLFNWCVVFQDLDIQHQ